MFTLEKNENGAASWRPLYIASIKNNVMRRVMMILFLPFTLVFVITLNLVGTILVWCLETLFYVGLLVFKLVVNVILAVAIPIKGVLFFKWRFWNTPRTSPGEKISLLDAYFPNRKRLYWKKVVKT